MANIFSACCGGFPGTSGINCNNNKAISQLYVKMNTDSLQNGFKISELDSTYIVIFESDTNNPFKTPIDTQVIFNSNNIYNYNPNSLYEYPIVTLATSTNSGNQEIKNSFKIFNTHSSIVYQLTHIETETLQNEKKCCQEYSSNSFKSYQLNGVLNQASNVIVVNKK